MLLPQRMEIITQELEKNGCVYVRDIAKKIGVTEKTIRQDLIRMEQMGILDRVHGGAVQKKEDLIFPIAPRKHSQLTEKRKIALHALSLIQDGDIIFFDAGSTCLELVRLIENQQIIALTNDPYIMNELLPKHSVSLYMIGGRLLREENSLLFGGPSTLDSILQYKTTKCFLGASAVSPTAGLMTFSREQAEIKRTIISCSSNVICLADYTKFGKMAFISYADLSSVDHIITDDQITPEILQQFPNINISIANEDISN
ncbi:MAG: DeoR/GlpR family DNA-binding transcription regulator [Agathobaculum sp.]|jgi:DeoR family fructose operon transcriptional repressor|uniref:DeoR/GlpR family DNA-binding transcription regulator n=1 Tax=Agathobaculum sp. TaxID=2048138 RepID=UPI003D8E5B33